MTITELKDAFIQMGLHAEINDLDEVVCVYENEAAAQAYDCFIEIPFDALLFFHVDTDIDAASQLDVEVLAKVEAIVSLFLMTPEEARGIHEATHSEKKYIIPMPGLQTSNGGQQFLSEKDGNYFSCKRTEDLHQVFTEDELNTEVPEVYCEFAEPVEAEMKEAKTIKFEALDTDAYRDASELFSRILGGLVHE